MKRSNITRAFAAPTGVYVACAAMLLLAGACDAWAAVDKSIAEARKAANAQNFSVAEVFYKQAVSSAQPGSLKLATYSQEFGRYYVWMKQDIKAQSYLEQALQIREKLLWPEHPHLISSRRDVGLFYRRRKEFNRAIVVFEKLIAGEPVAGNENNKDAFKDRESLSFMYSREHRDGDAEKLLRATIAEISEKQAPMMARMQKHLNRLVLRRTRGAATKPVQAEPEQIDEN